MATVGTFDTKLILESAAFIRDLNKAAQATARSTSQMQRNMSGLSKSFAAAGASLKTFIMGFVGLRSLSLLRNVVQSADSLGDAAARLGVGAEDLQRFRFAGEQAGLAVGELDTALKLFTKNLAAGKVTAEGDTLIDKFANTIQSIRDAPTEMAEIEIATKAAGKQFDVLRQIASEGTDEFRRWFTGAAVYTREALDTADQLDKQYRAIEQAISVGFGTGLIVAFIGKLELTKDELKKIEELSKSAGTEIGAFIKTTMREIYALANVGTKVLTALKRAAQDVGEAAMSDLRSAGILSMAGSSHAKGTIGAPEQPEPPALPDTKPMGEGIDRAKELAAATRAAREEERLWQEQVSRGSAILDATSTPFEQYKNSLREIGELLAANAITAETSARAQQAAVMQLAGSYVDAAAQVTGTLAGAFRENKAFAIANAVMSVAQGIVRAFELPFPLNWAQAAAVAAAGVAQINTIRSAQPGNASSSSFKGGGKSKGGGAVESAGAASRGGDLKQSVTIQITGDSFGPEHFKKMVDGLNGVISDGAVLRMG